jgi:hypothetical protein
MNFPLKFSFFSGLINCNTRSSNGSGSRLKISLSHFVKAWLEIYYFVLKHFLLKAQNNKFLTNSKLAL